MKKLIRPSCSVCKALAKAIDAYIAKVDNDLEDEMSDAGYVDAKDSVKAASALEEEVREILTEQTEEIAEVVENAGSIPKAKKKVSEYFEDDVTGTILSQTFADYFSDTVQSLANSYMKETEGDLVVSQLRARTSSWIEEWSGQLSDLMQLTSENQMGTLLQDALDNGEGCMTLAQRLLNEGIRNEGYRARATAVTEMLRAHSVAQQESIMQSPATDRKKWVHSGAHKNKPRENHIAMNGQIVPKAEPFELTGRDGGTYHPMYPRDPILPAAESINCHCIHIPVSNDDILGLSYEERRRMQQEIIAADDAEWEKELDANNKLLAGVVEDETETINLSGPIGGQEYREVTMDSEDITGTQRGEKSVTATRVTSANNKLYVSNDTTLKRRAVHNIDTGVSQAMDKLGISDRDNLPNIVVLSDQEMQKTTPSVFSAGENTIYVHEKMGGKREGKALQADFAAPKKYESTYVHELIHWEDAEEYQSKFGKIVNDEDYSKYKEWVNDRAKEKLAKLEESGYDLTSISDYASESLRNGNYDEVYTEYRVKILYEGE